MAPEPSSNTKLSDRVGWGVSSPHPQPTHGGQRDEGKEEGLSADWLPGKSGRGSRDARKDGQRALGAKGHRQCAMICEKP